jgi:hypothetical protein
MLAAPTPAAHTFPFPVADSPLSLQTRDALLPARPSAPWHTAYYIDRAADRLDLGCLAKLYRRRGSLPFSPLFLLKLALFCLADGRPSPSDWAQMANRDGPCRWIACGSEPSASVCYAFRDRLGTDCLLELNRQVLALVQADRLTPATRGALDGTLQDANASRHRLVNQRRLAFGLQVLQQPTPPAAPADAPVAVSAAALDEKALPAEGPLPPMDPTTLPANAVAAPGTDRTAPADTAPATSVVPKVFPAGKAASLTAPTATVQDPATSPQPAPAQATAQAQPQPPRRPVRPGRTPAGRQRQQQRWQRAQKELQQRQQRNQQKRASKQTDPAKMVISPTDPEAAVGRDKRGVFRPLYNAQLVADLDSDLILGYEVFAQPNDNGLLPVMLQRSAQLVGHPLALTLVDAGYTGGQELAAAEKAAVEILGPKAGQSREPLRTAPKQIPKGEFRYDAARDEYVCPEGQRLVQAGQSRQKRSSIELVVLTEYRASSAECRGCPRRQECCPKSKQGRSVSRSEHEGSVERLRARMDKAENKQLYKRRAATVERLFGDGKEQRGMDRVSGRGLKRARIQLALTVLQHNLRVLGRAMVAAAKQKGDPPLLRRTA